MLVSEMSFTQKYTYNNCVENIVLLEEHLKDLQINSKDAFCKECAYKHCSLISGFAKEGIGFFPNDAIWSEIRTWAMACRDGLKDITKNKATTYIELGRKLRKKLISTYEEKCATCEVANNAIRSMLSKKRSGIDKTNRRAIHVGHLKR